LSEDENKSGFTLGYTRNIDSEMTYEEIIMGEVERLRELFQTSLKRNGMSEDEIKNLLSERNLLKLAKKSFPYLDCPLNHYAYGLALVEQISEINEITREKIKHFVFIPFSLIELISESEKEALKDNPNIFRQNPMFCMLNCHTGHITECHFPKSCREAKCSHYWRYGMDLEM